MLATRAYQQLCTRLEAVPADGEAPERVAALAAEYVAFAGAAAVTSYAVWSLVHGYTTLVLEGAIGDGVTDPFTSDLLPAMLRLLDV